MSRLAAMSQIEQGGSQPAEALAGFRAVRWRGRLYWFNSDQRLAVQYLWRKWEMGAPFVAARAVALLTDSDAWGSLIVAGETLGGAAGTVCLAFA